MEAKFVKSCFKKEDYPVSEKREIVLLGRSNVGKSSFINALCNRKNLAYTSSTPGMTLGLNFYDTNDFVLVDAPGYGFQAKNKGNYESFDKLMNEYFSSRKQLKLGLLLVDVRRDVNSDDLDMLKYLQSHHIAVIIVLTKCDKVSNNVLFTQKRKIAKDMGLNDSVLYPTSALNKTGYDQILVKINETIRD